MITDNSLKSILEDWNNTMKSANERLLQGIHGLPKIKEDVKEFEDDLNIKLTQKEMGFLITCIQTAAAECFQYSPRFYKLYSPESGVKYDVLNKTEIIDLIRKLGGDEDDLEEFYNRI